MNSTPAYLDLLDAETLARMSRIEILARGQVNGFISGRHHSPYHGFSAEFADHREYAPGDDLHDLDWRVLGRSDRYYIKRYVEETNLRATILHCLGLDHERLTFRTQGRDFRLTDVHGHVVQDLLA